MTAFRQVVGKLQDGDRDEALIGLEFVLRLDPAYAPAQNLHQQISAGSAEIDLDDVMSQLQAPTTDVINELLVEAVEDFNNQDFSASRKKVEMVLLDLPGHQEARQLLAEIEDATKGNSQINGFLAQARDALAQGESQEAANFVMMAQALDPHHPEIAPTLAEIERSSDMSMSQAGFSSDEKADPDGAVAFAAETDAVDFSAASEAADLFAGGEVEAPPADAEFGNGDSPVFSPPEITPPAATTEKVDAPPPAAEPEGYYESGPADDVSGLFDESPASSADDAAGSADSKGDAHDTIRKLLAQGGAAAAEDDYASAINSWSKIFLLDPEHEEARDRIEHIRHAKEEVDRRIEPMLADAREALGNGDTDTAKDFVGRILALSPKHVDASRLVEETGRVAARDGGGGSGGGGESAMPELEDDLFSDEFASTTDFGSELSTTDTLEGQWRTPTKPKRRLPWQLWAIVGAASAMVLAFGLWVGSSFLPDEDAAEQRVDTVNRVLVEAAELYNLKKIDEAILLLEQNSVDDVFQVRIDNRLADYRKVIATPVPTAVPGGLAACREMLADGQWMAAYERVAAELKTHPNDPALEEIRAEILKVEPLAGNLYGAMATGDFRAAVGLSRDLLEKRTGDPEVALVYERSLFNAAMAEMRAFNLPAADGYLTELAKLQPEDEEVGRILEFVKSYKSRPVDMQLEIFVGSIALR